MQPDASRVEPEGPTFNRHEVAPTCLFCDAANPERHNVLVHSLLSYARYDNFPASRGHFEVVPRRHVESVFDLAADEVVDLHAVMVQAKGWVMRRWAPDGFTVGINEGRAAGRTIDHLHVHVLPRYVGDVPDPRGGVRNVLPVTFAPSLWSPQ